MKLLFLKKSTQKNVKKDNKISKKWMIEKKI